MIYKLDLDPPYGNIQWHETHACIDLKCPCGKTSHCDSYGLYQAQCPYCLRVFALATSIPMIELTEEQKKHIKDVPLFQKEELDQIEDQMKGGEEL